MSDKYPRVHQCLSDPEVWDEDDYSPRTHKVVPADAIVIERGELPEVTPGAITKTALLGGLYRGLLSWNTPESLRNDALRAFALAEHLRAHPPVDEREEAELAALLIDVDGLDNPVPHLVARRLLATGRVHVDTEGAPKGRS